MSSSNSSQMTEEHEKFLKSLEEEFKDRYTENDVEFQAVLNEKPSMPPIVENWVNSRQRDDRRGYFNRDYRDRDRERERFRDSRRYEGGQKYPHSSRYYYG